MQFVARFYADGHMGEYRGRRDGLVKQIQRRYETPAKCRAETRKGKCESETARIRGEVKLSGTSDGRTQVAEGCTATGHF